jgi:hypothetical protein
VTRDRRVRDEQGVVLPTRLLALCISAIALAALVFISNDPDRAPDESATTAVNEPESTPTPTATATATPTVKVAPKPKPVKRGQTYVTVFNNTRVKGLAGGVAEKAKAAGWNVVATDNWYGTVDSTAVYFPPKLKAAAQELGYDLGIKRIKPSQEPMQFDRLTVILTDDYHG